MELLNFLFRLLQFASAMLLFGVSVFQWSVAPAGVARALDQSLRQASKVAAIVLLATAIAWLLLAAGEVGEGWADAWNPSVIGSVILYTDFGRVWLWRLGAVVVLLAVLIFTRDNSWLIVAILAAIVLGSLGLVGHALMRSVAFGWLNRLSFIAHVLAAGFWLGSLAPLIASLRLAADQTGIAITLILLRRFSRTRSRRCRDCPCHGLSQHLAGAGHIALGRLIGVPGAAAYEDSSGNGYARLGAGESICADASSS